VLQRAGRVLTIAAVSGLLVILGSVSFSAPYGYSVRSNVDDHLHRIDLPTGVATDLGAVGFTDAEGIASDGVTLWAIGGTVNELWDITTPPGFKIGDTGTRERVDAGLAYDSTTGKLYNLQGDNGGSTLYEINPTTGAATQIGTDTHFGDGLAINSSGVAYTADLIFSAKLYSVNLTTGAFTEVGDLGLGNGQLGLGFDASDNLWGVGSDGDVYSINTGTGAATVVAQTTLGGSPIDGFEGLDCMVSGIAPGPPGSPPRLSWTGEPGFVADGVDPDIGVSGQTLFRFRVRLTDPDGDDPEYVRLIIRRNGQRFLNRRMWQRPRNPGTYAYILRSPLPPGQYTYHVRARDKDGFATGDPTIPTPGPYRLPQLLFGTAPGVEDGVRPNAGTEGETVFLFKVIYQDDDGDMPTFVRVLLWRDGTFYRWMEMVQMERPQNAVSPAMAGIPYRCRRMLPAGTYQYRFEAEDKDGRAIGPASVKMDGLLVNPPSAPAAVTSCAAIPTAAGAEIVFSLSAPVEVAAQVVNIAGRPVRTLCRAKGCDAGANTLAWNTLSDSGLPVPNGTYLVRIEARTTGGEVARGLATVSLRR
jgi:hypothetical protein